MMTGLEHISQIIRRYTAIEAVYLIDAPNQTSKQLEHEIVQLYKLVLKYQVNVVCHLNSRTALQVLRHLTSKVSWSDERVKIRAADAVCIQFLSVVDASRQVQRAEKLDKMLSKQNDAIRDVLAESHARDENLLNELQEQREDFRKWRDGREAQRCREILRTSDYEMMKNRNPKRIAGTCQWFLQHPAFQNWLDEPMSACLWVTADPGCGKSVLCRYLVDEYMVALRQSGSTVCYFFFKDGDYSATVNHTLCAILHQLVCSNEKLLKAVREEYHHNGEKLASHFEPLWSAFLKAVSHSESGQIICIIDALDECAPDLRLELVRKIRDVYAGPKDTSKLKLLITSRFTTEIRDAIYDFNLRRLGIIRLTGEAQKEMNIIYDEINLVIAERVQRFEELRRVGYEIVDDAAQLLSQRMSEIENRTYLWVSLIFPELERSAGEGKTALLKIFQSIPATVSAAYQRILDRSRDAEAAKKLLHIVLASRRPLTLWELKHAFLIDSEGLSLDIEEVSDSAFRTMARELCGLFIRFTTTKTPWGRLRRSRFILEDRFGKVMAEREEVSLIHQTAREFLEALKQSSAKAKPKDVAFSWQHCLEPIESNYLLARICILLLCSTNKEENAAVASADTDDYRQRRWPLKKYAEDHWTTHFNEAGEFATDLFPLASSLCISTASRCGIGKTPDGRPHVLLTAIWWELRLLVKNFCETKRDLLNVTEIYKGNLPIMQAIESGSQEIVNYLCEAGGLDVNALGNDGDTALMRAAKRSSGPIFEALLAVKCPPSPVNLRALDEAGLTILTATLNSSLKCHALLQYEHEHPGSLDINARDLGGRTSLARIAGERQYETRNLLVCLLSTPGIDVNLGDDFGQTPLWIAAWAGNGHAVEELLKAPGIDLDAVDEWRRTPLLIAIEKSHDPIAQLLVLAGASPNLEDLHNRTPLTIAMRQHAWETVKYLLDACQELDLTTVDHSGCTPLMMAAIEDRPDIAHRMLHSGNADPGDTDLRHLTKYLESVRGYERTVATLKEQVPGLTIEMQKMHKSWVKCCKDARILPLEAPKELEQSKLVRTLT